MNTRSKQTPNQVGLRHLLWLYLEQHPKKHWAWFTQFFFFAPVTLNLAYLPSHQPPPPPAFVAWPPPWFPLPSHHNLSSLPNCPLTLNGIINTFFLNHITMPPLSAPSFLKQMVRKLSLGLPSLPRFSHKLVLSLLIGSSKHSQLLCWSEAMDSLDLNYCQYVSRNHSDLFVNIPST